MKEIQNSSVRSDIAGLPVEIGLIEKELGKLWEESADTKTRASLINLVLYTEIVQDVEKNTKLIAEIANKHAFRAILVLAQPTASQNSAQAWINAHCHMAGKGKLQICSEQITFQLHGNAVASLPSIVFSHLDTDLPLCLWWQVEFPEKLDHSLWKLVDRLIFDSSLWQDAEAQSLRIQRILESGGDRLILCDLNWTRLYALRFAIASLFDSSFTLPYLSKISQIKLHHSPGKSMLAMLLLGWLAARLQWTLQEPSSSSSSLGFRSSTGATIFVELQERAGPPISLCRIEAEAGEVFFQIQRQEGKVEFYKIEMRGGGLPPTEQYFSAGKEGLADVLLEELSRSGKHPQYHQALKIIFPMLAPSNKILA